MNPKANPWSLECSRGLDEVHSPRHWWKRTAGETANRIELGIGLREREEPSAVNRIGIAIEPSEEDRTCPLCRTDLTCPSSWLVVHGIERRQPQNKHEEHSACRARD